MTCRVSIAAAIMGLRVQSVTANEFSTGVRAEKRYISERLGTLMR